MFVATGTFTWVHKQIKHHFSTSLQYYGQFNSWTNAFWNAQILSHSPLTANTHGSTWRIRLECRDLPAAGKVTVGRASYWSCATDSMVYLPTGWIAYKEGRWAPLLHSSYTRNAGHRPPWTFAPRHLPLQKITIADVCMLSGLQQDSEVDGRGVVNCP